ncbi:hydroxysqualene dehydroxylase HpnE [Caenispirillum salinarum]|uniref:hydroxysqualene dehydroxylase HpnE n=1 Tax=Caenispirillum salinarum TaxID=859058 RepID=UPI00384A6579
MSGRHLHVVGAGMAGLACAVEAVREGWAVTVHDSAPRAGGRCRSYHDPALDRVLDNGSHLMLSANTETRRLLETTGGWKHVVEVTPAVFAFHDLRDGTAFSVRPNAGPLPWWIFAGGRRAPGSTAMDHLSALWRLFRAPQGTSVAEALTGPLYDRVWYPIAEAVMNTAPAEACAASFRAVVRDSLLRGEPACRPWLFPEGLDAALVAPAVEWLEARGADVRLTDPVKGLEIEDARVTALRTRSGTVPVAPGDVVVSALPAFAAGRLLPELAPEGLETRAILNAHFRLPAPVDLPPPGFLGLIGGQAHWLFVRGDVLSVTVSAADALAVHADEEVAARLWSDVVRVPAFSHIGNPPPPSRVVRERRATLAHTPGIDTRRPGPRTGLGNLLLAGDWTATGYPCTVEGAVRSGVTAARTARTIPALHGPVE